MATYPPRGLTPWDLDLKTYLDDVTGDVGVSTQVQDGPLTRAALESFLLPRSEYNADVSWTEVSGKPTTFPPSSHSHGIADLPVGTSSTTVAAGNHTHTPASIGAAPTTHTHTKSQISDFAHTHAIADLPTGTSSTTVALGNHTHTPASIGAATSDHTHTPASIGAASSSHTHTAAEVGAAAASHSHGIADLPTGTSSTTVALGNHTHTPASIGAAPTSHTHTKSQISDFAHTHAIADLPTGTGSDQVALGNHTHTPASIGAAAATHTHTKSQITDFTHTHTYTDLPMSAAPSQAVAEAGTETTERVFTALRVRQNVAAYSYSKAQTDAAVAAAAAAAGANVTGAQVQRSVRDTTYTYASTLASHYGTTSGAAIIPGLGFTIVGDGKWYDIQFLGAITSSVANNVMGVWFPVNGSMSAAPGGVALSGTSAPQTARTITLTGGFQFLAASGTNYAITVGVGVVSSSATAGIAASALSPMWLRAVRCT